MKKRKHQMEVQEFLSSDRQYVIWKYNGSNRIRLYTLVSHASLYDLAKTIYNDCVKHLNAPVPLDCEVIFYHRRNYVSYFLIENVQTLDDILIELCQKLYL